MTAVEITNIKFKKLIVDGNEEIRIIFYYNGYIDTGKNLIRINDTKFGNKREFKAFLTKYSHDEKYNCLLYDKYDQCYGRMRFYKNHLWFELLLRNTFKVIDHKPIMNQVLTYFEQMNSIN